MSDIEKNRKPIATYLLLSLILLTFFVDSFTAEAPFSMGYLIYGNQAGILTEYGMLLPISEIRFEFWRLITVFFLHAGIPHLLVNFTALFLAGTTLERKLGSKSFLLVFFHAGIISSLVTMILFPHGSVGASGAIYDVISCMFFSKSFSVKEKYGLLKLILILLYLVLPNLSANTVLIAHGAGFLTGGALSCLTFLKREKTNI